MSDILIRDMEMPKNCGECFACKAELSNEKKIIYVCCFTRKEYGFDGNRMDDCPLVLVPPHDRCIDADALWVEINKICTRCGNEEPKPNFNLSYLELAKRDNDESQSHLCNSLDAMRGVFIRLGSTNDDAYIPVKASTLYTAGLYFERAQNLITYLQSELNKNMEEK